MDSAPALQARPPALGFRARVTPLRLAIALMMLAAGVRLIGIDLRPMWLDEAYSAWFSARGWHELWTVVPTYETHPPFYYSLLKLWRQLAGGGSLALRLPSVLFGALTAGVTVAAALELDRVRPTGRPLFFAAAAGFLVACSPTLVQHGQEARPYALMALAYGIAILGLLRLMRDFEAGPGRWSSWAILSGGTELTLWSHGLGLFYALVLAAALAPAWLAGARRARILRGLASAAAIGLLYLPCLLIVVLRAHDWGSGWLRWSPELLLKLLGLYAVPAEVLTIVAVPAVLIMMLLAKRAIQAPIKGRGWSADRALMLLWWAPPLLTALISAAGMPLFLPRTLTPTLVPCCLALALALARTPSPRERVALGALLALSLLPASIHMALRPAGEQWDQVSAYLEQNIGPNDLVWLYPNDSALPLRAADPDARFARRGIPADYPAIGAKGPIRAGSPAVVSLTPDGAERFAADPSLRSVPTVWLVTAHQDFFDPSRDVPHALERTRLAGAQRTWGYLAVQPFSRR